VYLDNRTGVINTRQYMANTSCTVSDGTSAQLGYTVTFTSVHAVKHRTEDKLKIKTLQKLNVTHNKQKNAKHSTSCTEYLMNVNVKHWTQVTDLAECHSAY